MQDAACCCWLLLLAAAAAAGCCCCCWLLLLLLLLLLLAAAAAGCCCCWLLLLLAAAPSHTAGSPAHLLHASCLCKNDVQCFPPKLLGLHHVLHVQGVPVFVVCLVCSGP
jgi:hypothetical protein